MSEQQMILKRIADSLAVQRGYLKVIAEAILNGNRILLDIRRILEDKSDGRHPEAPAPELVPGQYAGPVR